MVSIGKRIFGYRVITPEHGHENRLVGIFLSLGISAQGRADGSFLISEGEYRRFSAYAGGRARYIASETLGFLGLIKRNRSKFPLAIAFILGVMLNVFLSGIVWDVRVSGNERLDKEIVTQALASTGFGVGSFWGDFDPEHTEGALLSAVPDVAWVQINRRGTVAYVQIKERAPITEQPTVDYICSNIVADRDCVIESITVESGRAAVKPGDVVRRGDILISGIVETESGSLFCRAEGQISAHATGKAEYLARHTYKVVEYERSHTLVRGVRIFALRINIFKNYGNLDTDYDIIENEEELVLPNGCVLPFAIYESYVNMPISYSREYTDAQLPAIASEGLFSSLYSELGGKDLIKLHTSGVYTDEGYLMSAEYVYSCEVGKEIEIDLGDTYDRKNSYDTVE